MENSPLEFPCDHDIKVMGRDTADFREVTAAAIVAELGDGAADRVAAKASGKGAFVSLTYTVHVESRIQLDRVYRALHATGLVLYAL